MKRFLTVANLTTLIGAMAGYLYWQEYACTEGCAITSTWYGSTVVGGIFGNLIGDIVFGLFNKEVK